MQKKAESKDCPSRKTGKPGAEQGPVFGPAPVILMGPKDLAREYGRQWETKFNRPFTHVWSKEVAQFKRLLKTHEAQDLVAYIGHWFTRFRHPFATRAAFSFGAFLYLINEIVADYVTEESKRTATNPDATIRAHAREQLNEQGNYRDTEGSPSSGGKGKPGGHPPRYKSPVSYHDLTRSGDEEHE